MWQEECELDHGWVWAFAQSAHPVPVALLQYSSPQTYYHDTDLAPMMMSRSILSQVNAREGHLFLLFQEGEADCALYAQLIQDGKCFRVVYDSTLERTLSKLGLGIR